MRKGRKWGCALSLAVVLSLAAALGGCSPREETGGSEAVTVDNPVGNLSASGNGDGGGPARDGNRNRGAGTGL